MTDPTQAYPVASLNNVETDDQWERFTGTFAASGVDAGTGSGSLRVSLNVPGRAATIAPGGGFVKGRYRPAQATADSVPIPAASTQDRYDRVVLRLNRTASALADVLKPVIITGTPATSPTKPALLNDATLCDIPLASYRAAASGTLTALTDERRFIGLTLRAAPTAIGVPTGTPNGSLWWQSDGTNSVGQLLVKQKDDGTHIVAAQDTDWVDLSTFGTFWERDTSYRPGVRAKNGHGSLIGAAVRKSNDLSAGDDGSNVVQIPAAYRPGRLWVGSGVFGSNPPGVCRLRIDPDSGWVSVEQNSRVINARTGSDQSTGTHIYLSQVPPWPIG